MEKKDGEYKINEPKEKGIDSERDGNQKLKDQIKYQEKMIILQQ